MSNLVQLNLQPNDVEHCRALTKKHGKSYYFSTLFFPKAIQEATFVLYAFFRVPDDIVDIEDVNAAAIDRLNAWREEWRAVYGGAKTDDSVLRSAAAVFHAYSIPFEYSESFLDAMIQDTKKARYANYEELEEYMYGSAAVVGLMMTHVIGFSNKRALEHAKELGYAMQLTNFLRDIREDIADRDRLYMPQDELEHFSVSEEDIRSGNVTPAFIAFMQFQIKRARGLYQASTAGIPLLNAGGRFPVLLAAQLYSRILFCIEEAKYDVFTSRVHTSTFQKILLAITLWITKRLRL